MPVVSDLDKQIFKIKILYLMFMYFGYTIYLITVDIIKQFKYLTQVCTVGSQSCFKI